MATDPAMPDPRRTTNPRHQALEIISQALSPTGHAFARDLLEERLTEATMKPEDRRLAADLTYGVIRRMGTLDAVLAAFASRPLKSLEPAILNVLRLGAYQLLFQERIPAHAAVDESVRLARSIGKHRATGFINAILRGISRSATFATEADPSAPRRSFEVSPGRACLFIKDILPPPENLSGYLAALHSFPESLVRRWLARYGRERAEELFRTANQPAPIFLRPNTLRVTLEELQQRLAEEGVQAEPSPSGRTLRLPPHAQPARLKVLAEGFCLAQDDAAAAVAPFLEPKPDENIADLCAAPGGKSCQIAELMGNRGVVVAVDVSARRLKRVVENMRRLDIGIIATVEADATVFAQQHAGKFDRVLLDAPCSNTGVLRRRVEARWRFSEDSLPTIAAQQRALFDAALRCLRPGGTMVYSACSLEPEENGDLVRAALTGTSFRIAAEQQLLPSLDGGDGMYMARIILDRI